MQNHQPEQQDEWIFVCVLNFHISLYFAESVDAQRKRFRYKRLLFVTGVGSITYLYVKNPTDSENVRNSKVCVNLNIIRNDCIDSQGQGLKDTIGYSTIIQALYVSFTLTIHSSGNKQHIVLQYLCTKMLVLPS